VPVGLAPVYRVALIAKTVVAPLVYAFLRA
jgi:hypothetical protein